MREQWQTSRRKHTCHPWNPPLTTAGRAWEGRKMPVPGKTLDTWLSTSQPQQSARLGTRLTLLIHSYSFVNRTPTQRVLHTPPPISHSRTPMQDLFIQPKDPTNTKEMWIVSTKIQTTFTPQFFKHSQDQQGSSQKVTKWISALTPVIGEIMTHS